MFDLYIYIYIYKSNIFRIQIIPVVDVLARQSMKSGSVGQEYFPCRFLQRTDWLIMRG